MNKIMENDSVLVIIDVQEKLVKMLEDNSCAKVAEILAKTASVLKLPVIITEQYPKGLGSTLNEISNVLPNAIVLEKTSFSAFDMPEFTQALKNFNKKQIIIMGIEAHICVLQTATDLINNGYEVFIVEDAIASRNIKNKEAALKRLIHFGSQVVTSEMVIFELLKSSKHPNFKEIQSLIK